MSETPRFGNARLDKAGYALGEGAFFTLPWRGRVGEHRRCEPGWGERIEVQVTPPRLRFAQSTLPEDGEG